VKQVHGVDLLEAAVLTFDQEEEHDEDKDGTAAGEYQAIQVVDGVGNEAGEEAEHEVPEPVTGGGDGHAGGPVFCRVQFSGHGPDNGAPGRRECNNKQAREGDEDVSSLRRARWVILVEHEVADKRVDHEADKHPNGTKHQGHTPPGLLHDDEATECTSHVHGAEDYLGDVAIAQTGRLENAAGCLVSKQFAWQRPT
jgi:hypothetical protein